MRVDAGLQRPTTRIDAEPRIAIIANRGPNDFVWEDRRWATRISAGGLVSMLEPLARQPDVVWFCCESEPPGARAARRGLFTTAADQTDSDLHIIPVPLPAPLYHAYCGQISNEVLWMLQHQIVGPGGFERLDQRRHRAWDGGYLEANRRLASTIASSCPSVRAFLIPSRTDLSIYRTYRDRIFEQIEAINARYAEACGGPPIEIFYTNDREQALAAMEACDVLLVNSLKDGMNLVANEWAVVSTRPGALVLSETAGVADEAGGSALPVSPLDVEGTARALADAFDMPTSERMARLVKFRDRVTRWTAADWLSAQLADLGLASALPAQAEAP